MRLPTWLRRKPPLPKRAPATPADLPTTTPQDVWDHLDAIEKLTADARAKYKEVIDLYWVDDVTDELRGLLSQIGTRAAQAVSGTHGIQRRERALRRTLADILDLPETGGE